jgi:hypothetical protein
MKYNFFLSALALLLFAYSCNDEPPVKSVLPTPDPEPTLVYDTTSHNITWFADTLGDYGQELNDIWAADSVSFYAVGKINISSNPNRPWRSIVKWNGSQWVDVPNIGYGESNELGGIGRAIFGFGNNNIWVAKVLRMTNGATAAIEGFPFSHYNGVEWKTYYAPPPSPSNLYSSNRYIYDMWGSDPNHLWAVGDSGLIYFWNGSVWRKQAVPQEVQAMHLTSIFGFSANEVYVTGAGVFYGETVLMRYDGTQWSVVNRVPPGTYPYDFFGKILGGKWKMGRNEEERLWVVRQGRVDCWDRKKFPNQITLQTDLTNTRVGIGGHAASGSNIIITGSDGEIAHWNGVSWHTFENPVPPTFPSSVSFSDVEIKGKTIIGVGRSYQGIDRPYYLIGRQE